MPSEPMRVTVTKKSKLHQNMNATPAASATAANATSKPAKAAPPITLRHAPKAAARAADGSKIGAVIRMLGSKRGASIEELMKTTGWQSHSVRGAISGAIKKRLGLKITSERVNDTRTYRIVK